MLEVGSAFPHSCCDHQLLMRLGVARRKHMLRGAAQTAAGGRSPTRRCQISQALLPPG